MRAIQISELGGPDALREVDLPEPEASHMLTPGEGVLVDVECAGVSFPEVLQTRGEYQFKPPLPFVPGGEVAGIVRSAPEGSDLSAGDRVAATCMLGGWADVAVAPAFLSFRLPDELDMAQGSGLVLNYHTAYFSLVTRGRLAEGETVLVHGAAGGVGTATIQVAKGLGARVIGVVSDEEKEAVAREAGADEVVRSDGAWNEGKELSGGGVGRHDPVGGDRFPTRSARWPKGEGRRRRLHRRFHTRGQGQSPAAQQRRDHRRGWSAYVMGKPEVNREIGGEIERLIRDRTRAADHRRALPARAGRRRQLRLLDARGATGKVVLEL